MQKPLMPKRRLRRFLPRLTISLVTTAVFCALTGVIPRWGDWYSGDLNYRKQTDAFLNGAVSLSDDPASLQWDWVWWDGRCQQVWGLGVPLWRFLFEAESQLMTGSPFPDRLAFVSAVLAVSYLVQIAFPIRTWRGEIVDGVLRRPSGVLALLILVLSAPFLTLCRTRFWVYEEAQAYAYLTGIALLSLTVMSVRRPSAARFAAVAVVGGVAAFVRPTLIFYGAGSLAVTLLYAKARGVHATRLLVPVALFIAGLVALGASNADRFGSPLEFGHRLNLNGIDRMRFATRFGHPYSDELILSATQELFGALFLAGDSFNGDDWYAHSIFPGQSDTTRWREMYFTTYGIATLVMLIAVWTWGVAWLLRSGIGSCFGANAPLQIKLLLWSLTPIVLLVLFYLRFPFLASRYLIDFAPAFAACLLALALALNHALRLRRVRPLASGALVIAGGLVFWNIEVISSAVYMDALRFPRQDAVNRSEIERQTDSGGEFVPAPIPVEYYMGMNADGRIPLNGSGWSATTGQANHTVAFFVEDPDWIEIVLGGDAEALDEASAVVRGRVGLQELGLAGEEVTQDSRVLRYCWPEGSTTPRGVQVLVLGMATSDQLGEATSPYLIRQVRWRDPKTQNSPTEKSSAAPSAAK